MSHHISAKAMKQKGRMSYKIPAVNESNDIREQFAGLSIYDKYSGRKSQVHHLEEVVSE